MYSFNYNLFVPPPSLSCYYECIKTNYRVCNSRTAHLFSISCHRLLFCKLWHVPYWVALCVRACVCVCICARAVFVVDTLTHTGEQTHTQIHVCSCGTQTHFIYVEFCADLPALLPSTLPFPNPPYYCRHKEREERRRVGNIACKLSRFSNTLPPCYPKNIFSFSFLLSTNAAACVLKRKISFSF